MSSLNNWIGMGWLTAAPELRTTSTGVEVTGFTVAIDRPNFKEKEKETDFINCVAWRKTAAFICKYFKKGDMIALEGRLQIRKYEDKEGNKRTAAEIQVDQCHFCGSKSSINVTDDENYSAPLSSSTAGTETIPNDDDLPF